MKIKKQFLNEESLKPYGFKREDVYKTVCEYWLECKYCDVLIQRIDGEIAIVVDGGDDTFDIPDVVYRLIKDGLVEI